MSPYVLGILSVLMFGLGIWQHYSMFPYEYRSSIVTEMLKEYSGFVMLLAVIVGSTVTVLMMYGASPPAANNLVSNVIASNNTNTKSIFNLSGNANANTGIAGVMNNISKTVNNAFKPANNIASASFKVT